MSVNDTITAEQAVLGSMLIDARCIPDVLEVVRDVDFQFPVNRDMVTAIRAMSRDGAAIDAVTLMERMKRCGTYTTETRQYILQLVDITPTSANVAEYAEIVRDNGTKCRLRERLTALLNDDTMTGAQLLDKAYDDVQKLVQGGSAGGIVSMGEMTTNFFEALERRAEGKTDGVSTGFRTLDDLLSGGFLNRGLYFLAGRPGMGKTTFALNVAMRTPGSVLYITLEMDESQLTPKIFSMHSGVNSKRLLTATNLTAEEFQKVAAAAGQVKQKFYINRLETMSVEQIGHTARAVPELSMVVIDYLGLIQSDDKKLYEKITAITADLKMLARRLNVPILCLAQLSRALESRDDKHPKLSDLRDSGSIEQDADGVLFIYRQDYYDRKALQSWEPSLVEVDLAKNRHGEIGKVFYNAYLANNLFQESR